MNSSPQAATKTQIQGVSKILSTIIASVVMAIITPIALIWALNTMFPQLHIPCDFTHWAAMILVRSIFTGKPMISFDYK